MILSLLYFDSLCFELLVGGLVGWMATHLVDWIFEELEYSSLQTQQI